MLVRDIMNLHFECVTRETPIYKAAERMRDLDVGMLPVKNEPAIIGVVTDRDITVRATARALNPNDTPVGEVMTTRVYSCFEDSDVHNAARIMEEHQVRRLLVQNDHGQYTGILSLADLVSHWDTEELGITVLEEVSQPSVHSNSP